MDEIYEHASSERIKSLERDLVREMKDLQNEIEDGSFLGEWNSYYAGRLFMNNIGPFLQFSCA